uniref:Fun34 transmembrane protein n=1 Tax=Moniliophthora roreri TaxID=221103 RepID=A0A0W0EY98_MONRR
MSDIEKGTSRDGPVQATSPQNGLGDDVAYRLSPTSPVKNTIANPASLGLFSFASTTLILSLYNAGARDIDTPNVVIGMALFCGGLAQLLAGMWEFPKGNTFGATGELLPAIPASLSMPSRIRAFVRQPHKAAQRPHVVPIAPWGDRAFSSYGAFWLSYATVFIPGSGIAEAYTSKSGQMRDAVAIYLITWMIVTFLLFIVSLRKSVSFMALFGLLTITFLLLSVSDFTRKPNVAKAGGVFGVLTAFVAYYIGLSELLTAEKKAVARLPLGVFKHD